MSSREKFLLADYLGKRIGERLVVGGAPSKGGAKYWLMRCDCGREGPAQVSTLLRGRALRCVGCRRRSQSGNGHPSWTGHGAVTGASYAHFHACARKRGIAWLITIEDISRLYERQNGLCALSGRPLKFRTGRRGEQRQCASLDRKDSSQPYTPENIQITTSDVNMGKQCLSDDEFVQMCRDVVAHADRN